MASTMSWAPRAGRRPPRRLSSNAGLVSAPGPAGAFIADPRGEGLAQPGVHGDLGVAAAFAGPHGDLALRAGSCTSASRPVLGLRRGGP
jgi:hypothetical protein